LAPSGVQSIMTKSIKPRSGDDTLPPKRAAEQARREAEFRNLIIGNAPLPPTRPPKAQPNPKGRQEPR
jgi:hypothetical protein